MLWPLVSLSRWLILDLTLLLFSIQGVQRSNSILVVQGGAAEGVYVHGADKGSDCFVRPGVISAVTAGETLSGSLHRELYHLSDS